MRTILGFAITIALGTTTGCMSAVDQPDEDYSMGDSLMVSTDDEAIGEAQQGNTFGGFVGGTLGLVGGAALGGLGGAALGLEIGKNLGGWAEDAVNGPSCGKH